jgi:hypothetical protein
MYRHLRQNLAYSHVECGGAENCDCNGCRNLVTARERLSPKAFLEFSATLGVDPLKDAETYHNARLAPGRHDYDGWFHFGGRLNVVDFDDGFTAWLCMAGSPRHSTFEDLSVEGGSVGAL